MKKIIWITLKNYGLIGWLFYIGLGYLLSVFGKSTDDNCPCCIELMIIVFSCIFFGVAILTSNFMSKSKLEKWKQLKDKEIENKQ